MAESRVIIVMDRDYGPNLRLLPEEVPAWVVDSPANHPVILELWESRRRWNQAGVLTSFLDNLNMSREDHAVSMLGTIDLHHGAYSQTSPWNVARVIGVNATASLLEAMRSLGFKLVKEEAAAIEFCRSEARSAQKHRS